MRVLVIGSGGREHALIWKIRQSFQVTEILCAPGNGGIIEHAQCVPIEVNDFKALADFAEDKMIDLTIVGPEEPLTNGIVNYFQDRGLRIFGPTKEAARIEGSKVFAKELMKKYKIPTAEFAVFSKAADALNYLKTHPAPIVVKASGLAAGKGSIVCMTDNEAKDAVKTIMKDRKFGKAGDEIVIEEFLEGEELSLFAVTDGKEYKMLPSAQDHKAVFDDDKGPNTGGMGAYAPAPVATPELMMKIEKSIIKPVIKAMAKEGCPYKGLLYAGLMITKKGPKVIEFNCRFGDPETQVILPLLKSDFLMLLNAAVEGQLEDQNVDFNHKCAAGVMLASGGYPGPYETGKEIFGFSHLIMNRRKIIFHSGTELRDGTYYTNGGRVICMTSVHFGLREAINEAYEMVDDIHFLNKHFRNDIGKKALERLT